jgi:hypothetical protein
MLHPGSVHQYILLEHFFEVLLAHSFGVIFASVDDGRALKDSCNNDSPGGAQSSTYHYGI